MRKFFRTPLNWFIDPVVESAPASPASSVGIHDATLDEAYVESMGDLEEETQEAPLEISEGMEVESPELEVVVQFNTMVSEPIIEVIAVREPGPVVRLMKRGPRLYSICPHCEASWSLRDRLYDPRTGRPSALDALVCPGCLKSVSVPGDLDLRKIQ